jgi:hypothetical protein
VGRLRRRLARGQARQARPGAFSVAPALLAASLGVAACGGASAASPKAEQHFLDSVYSQAPDISSYRTGPQLISLGQTVCSDLRAGASVEQLGDRLPLVEGSVALPPADLGAVISAAVKELCPQFTKLLAQ